MPLSLIDLIAPADSVKAGFTKTNAAIAAVNANVPATPGAPLASPAFTGTPTVPTASPGTSSTQVASTAFVSAAVSAAINGLTWKGVVRAATTANGTLATAFAAGQTVDGVTLAAGDRILLKNQSTASENGIYVVAASGAPARAADADAGAELVSAFVSVAEGAANADTNWQCTTNAPITLGTTALAWAAFVSGGSVTLSGLPRGAAGKSITGTGAGSDPVYADPAGDLTTATDGATVTFNLATSRRQIVTLGGNRTIALSGDADGMAFTLILKQDGTGTRTVTWFAGIKWAGGSPPTLTTTAGKYDVVAFLRIASGEYLGFLPSLNH